MKLCGYLKRRLLIINYWITWKRRKNVRNNEIWYWKSRKK